MSSSLVISSQEKKKKSLLRTIEKKRKVLLTLTAKVEMLRMDLDIIKREYHTRIGRLYLKDDQLDLEIIRYKTIKSLIEKGFTYDEAVKKVNEQYYAEKKVFDFRNEEILHDEQLLAKRQHIYKASDQEVKILWKKLLFQLHPDLTTNQQEKKQREIIMRKINDAYAENDFETLKSIENQHYIEPEEESTIENLENKIVEIETRIVLLENQYADLQVSEWYTWRKKSVAAKKKNIDIFKKLEEDLLEDVVKKITLVTTFRKEFDEKGYY